MAIYVEPPSNCNMADKEGIEIAGYYRDVNGTPTVLFKQNTRQNTLTYLTKENQEMMYNTTV